MAMSKTNDPSGTAVKVLQHPRLAWFIRKLAIWFVIIQYRWTARLHVRFRNLSKYRLFRYEDLLAEPERTLKELCKFIDVEFTDGLLHPETGHHEHQPSSLTGKQQKAFDVSAAVRWQEAIPPFDKWLITILTKRSMKILGYDPDIHPIFRLEQHSLPRLSEEVAQSV
jgi:hypothetical protein